MKQSVAVVLAVVVLSLWHSTAFAQGQSPNSWRSQVAFLAGRFTTETTIPAGPMAPKGDTGKGSALHAWGLDSMWLVIDEESMSPLMGHYKGHGALGFDATTREYVLSMFNNFGDHPSYKGTFSGDTLVMSTRIPMPKRPFDQKLLWYKDGETVRLRIMNDMGKGYVTALEQSSVRASQSSK
jgi:hypothetical protein